MTISKLLERPSLDHLDSTREEVSLRSDTVRDDDGLLKRVSEPGIHFLSLTREVGFGAPV